MGDLLLALVVLAGGGYSAATGQPWVALLQGCCAGGLFIWWLGRDRVPRGVAE